MRFDVKVFGLTCGIFWALTMFVLGLSATFLNYGDSWVAFLGSIYIGFDDTLFGTLLGVVWAFVDWWIAGTIFAWLYNLLIDKISKKAYVRPE